MEERIKINSSIIILVLQILCLVSIDAQMKPIGIPVVKNYPTGETGASTHSWDIIQDDNGIIYFANDAGVLRYDVEEWKVFPVSNGSIVRSLAIDDNGRILVGAYTEIGMLEQDSHGELKYTRLNHLIPEENLDFDDVWKIHNTSQGIVFQSFEYLFILSGDSIKVIEPDNRFGFSYYVDNKLYVVEKEEGLKVLRDGMLELISDDPLFTEDEIRFILPWNSRQVLIGSFSRGIYILSGSRLEPWESDLNQVAIDKKLYTGIDVQDQIVIGTIYDGLYACNREGQIIQHFNRATGLQNNTVLSAYKDYQDNLWLGLDNGIDYLKISLPVSFLNYNMGIETVYASMIHKGRLYVGTNQGLFTKEVANLGDPGLDEFDIVENTDGQVWTLHVEGDDLLCGHNRGAYLINGNTGVKISEARGVWNFFKLDEYDDYLFSGTYDGIISYRKDEKGNWREFEKIKGFELSCRRIIPGKNDNIWISHDHEGLFLVRLNHKLDSVMIFESYDGNSGLEGEVPYKIHKMDGQFFVSTKEGCYSYDSGENRFKSSDRLNTFFEDLGRINLLHEDNEGNKWYFTREQIGLFRLLEDGTYINIYTPFLILRNMLLKDYENIYTYDHDNVFIGTINGLVHFDASIYKDYFVETSTYIKKVIISNRGNDSLLAYGSMSNKLGIDNKEIDFNWNTIRLNFACPDLENSENIEYSYRLLGFSGEWSDWSPGNEKEYTNLSEGKYIFEVKAKNIFNNVSKIDRFHFEIEPPFFRSRQAFFIYISLVFLGVSTIIILVRRRISRVRSYEKQKHTAVFQKKEQQLEKERLSAQRELERIRIEKLEADMKHKSKELVNSTYHIIRKNKILNSVKQELAKLSDQAKSELVEQELKKISRKIDRDINNEKNWEVFDRYFDEVHQEFLSRLKEVHPELSPKDLRLASYLRMNISSKEIAPLLNISIRGVEISRYRLRKKMHLDRDTNLTEYLLNI
ncbi:MAG: ligand-binding sensor domain-containing protein [bacterium]